MLLWWKNLETSFSLLLFEYRHLLVDIERPKIDCLSFVYVPATSAAHNRLLFFFFLLQPFTVLMKKTCAVKQSIFLDVYAFSLT